MNLPFPNHFFPHSPPLRFDVPMGHMHGGSISSTFVPYHRPQQSIPTDFLPLSGTGPHWHGTGPVGWQTHYRGPISPESTVHAFRKSISPPKRRPPVVIRSPLHAQQASIGTSSLPATPRKAPLRGLVVLFPLEHGPDEDDRVRSLWRREALDEPFVVSGLDEELEVVSRHLAPEEEEELFNKRKLPPTLDIYLPGNLAWRDYLTELRCARASDQDDGQPQAHFSQANKTPPSVESPTDSLAPSPLLAAKLFPAPPTSKSPMHSRLDSFGKLSALSAEFHPRPTTLKNPILAKPASDAVKACDAVTPAGASFHDRQASSVSTLSHLSKLSSDAASPTSSRSTLSQAEAMSIRSAALATLAAGRESRQAEHWRGGSIAEESFTSNPSDEDVTAHQLLHADAPAFQPRSRPSMPSVNIETVKEQENHETAHQKGDTPCKDRLRHFKFPPSPPVLADTEPANHASPADSPRETQSLPPMRRSLSAVEPSLKSAPLFLPLPDTTPFSASFDLTLSRRSSRLALGPDAVDHIAPPPDGLPIEAASDSELSWPDYTDTDNSSDLQSPQEILEEILDAHFSRLRTELAESRDSAASDIAAQIVTALSDKFTRQDLRQSVKKQPGELPTAVQQSTGPSGDQSNGEAANPSVAAVEAMLDRFLVSIETRLAGLSSVEPAAPATSDARTCSEEVSRLREQSLASDAQVVELRRLLKEKDEQLQSYAKSEVREQALAERLEAADAETKELRDCIARLETAHLDARLKLCKELETASSEIRRLQREVERQEELAIRTPDTEVAFDWSGPPGLNSSTDTLDTSVGLRTPSRSPNLLNISRSASKGANDWWT